MMHATFPWTTSKLEGATDPVPIRKIKLSTPKGAISAMTISPASEKSRTLVALHGISRDPGQIFDAFAVRAVASGNGLIVPNFDADAWPVFQRVTRRHRPDVALLALLDAMELRSVALFGYSGGAQLAHRFAMLYPNRVSALHLGAPGWVTLPDASIPYPLGLKGAGFATAMRKNLDLFRAIPVTIWCGTDDIGRDSSLRTSPTLDTLQGATRLARAEAYHDALAQLGMSVRLHRVDGIGHDFAACAEAGCLERHVFPDTQMTTGDQQP